MGCEEEERIMKGPRTGLSENAHRATAGFAMCEVCGDGARAVPLQVYGSVTDKFCNKNAIALGIKFGTGYFGAPQ
jgi:hypothetical protein